MGGNSSKLKRNKYNALEMLREANDVGTKTIKQELISPISRNFAKQLFGLDNFTAETEPGGTIEMKDVFSGKHEGAEKTRKAVRLERQLLEEERVYVENRTNELKLQIQAIHTEILKVAEVTPELSQEVRVAVYRAPGDPSSYELNFLQQLFELVRDFRIKIENASVWLSACNSRASKRNMWGQNYKKHGGKYLLSSEHYLTRSAG